jgi:hypothetical protein
MGELRCCSWTWNDFGFDFDNDRFDSLLGDFQREKETDRAGANNENLGTGVSIIPGRHTELRKPNRTSRRLLEIGELLEFLGVGSDVDSLKYPTVARGSNVRTKSQFRGKSNQSSSQLQGKSTCDGAQ